MYPLTVAVATAVGVVEEIVAEEAWEHDVLQTVGIAELC